MVYCDFLLVFFIGILNLSICSFVRFRAKVFCGCSGRLRVVFGGLLVSLRSTVPQSGALAYSCALMSAGVMRGYEPMPAQRCLAARHEALKKCNHGALKLTE